MKAYLESVYAYKSGSTKQRGICAYYPNDASPVTVSDYLAVTPDNVS